MAENHKKFRTIEPGISLYEAVVESICFGWIDGKMHSLDSNRFIFRFTPRKPSSVWSMINRIRAETLVADERMTEAGIVKIREAQLSGRWQAAYTSRIKPDIPGDLNEALHADPLASRNFENWSNSQKLLAVKLIEKSRQSKTRGNRINMIVNSAHNEHRLF